MKSITKILGTLMLTLALFSLSNNAKAHCEIPCGIYGDSTRVTLMYEHIATIEKSINQIVKLSEGEVKDHNQLVRWVINKEEHATKIQEIASQYFMHQRIKVKDSSDPEGYAVYIKQLTLMHKIQVYAMKAKQATDLKYIKLLRETLHDFEHAYFGGH
ncbi:superoxide dismutase [Ni] [Labilibacter marinus]|uniref:superoxide dismutase [Ni] n=1 Tax=Labilibacter marinus TaxID=1477105 RepID=UPI0008357FDA|nr:superoxide dismutase [Ni] [Labilibacter marinus]